MKVNIKGFVDGAKKVWKFMVSDVWDVEPNSLSAIRAMGVRLLRVLHLVFKGFKEDECPLHASALTFSSLMAIVPILAFSLAMARGFGADDAAKNKIREAIEGWTSTFSTETNINILVEEPGTNAAALTSTNAANTVMVRSDQVESAMAAKINQLLEEVFDKIENVKFKALGGLGLVLMLWMVIQVLGRIEGSFNTVWGITSGRSMWRKFTDYLSIMVVLPILIVAAGSLPVVDIMTRFLNAELADQIRRILLSGPLRGLMVVGLTTLCFTFIITFLPNTKVRLGPGLAGGFVTAVLFVLWLKACASLQVGVARSNAIYGSFALVPIIIAWVHVSWEIVLFGAEVAFAVQNCNTYRMERGSHGANMEARLLLALGVVREAGLSMIGERDAFCIETYAGEKRIPVRFLNEVVDMLVKAGLLAELSEREGHYVLLRAPEHLKVHDVVETTMRSGVKPEDLGLGILDARIKDAVSKVSSGLGVAFEKLSVRDIMESEVPAV